MFQQSFHFNCIHFRGSTMVFPYLHMICNQVLLDYRLCLLIYIIPMASVTRELNSCRRAQTAGQVCNINYLVWYRNGLLVPVLRDGCRRDWERWLLQLNLPVGKMTRNQTSSKDRGGEGTDGQGVWRRSRVISEMTSGFLFWISMKDGGGFSACAGKGRRDARCLEVISCHFCREVTETLLRHGLYAMGPHGSHSAHGAALNLHYFEGDQPHTFSLQLTQSRSSDPSCGK